MHHTAQHQGLPHPQSIRESRQGDSGGERDVLAGTEGNWRRGGNEAEERGFRFLVRSVHLADAGILLTPSGRIGVKALQSNALLAAQKQNGSATINEKSLKHFDKPKSERRSASPSKGSTSSADKGKGKSSAKNSDGEEEEDSGDEAEKLDEKQMNELDTIYRK